MGTDRYRPGHSSIRRVRVALRSHTTNHNVHGGHRDGLSGRIQRVVVVVRERVEVVVKVEVGGVAIIVAVVVVVVCNIRIGRPSSPTSLTPTLAPRTNSTCTVSRGVSTPVVDLVFVLVQNSMSRSRSSL